MMKKEEKANTAAPYMRILMLLIQQAFIPQLCSELR